MREEHDLSQQSKETDRGNKFAERCGQPSLCSNNSFSVEKMKGAYTIRQLPVGYMYVCSLGLGNAASQNASNNTE